VKVEEIFGEVFGHEQPKEEEEEEGKKTLEEYLKEKKGG